MTQHPKETNSSTNRLVFIYLVKFLYKLINLIHSTNETSLLMPVELAEQIFFILNDVSLMHAIKIEGDEESVLSAILCHLDKTLYDIYVMSNEVSGSMRHACEFLSRAAQSNYMSYDSRDFVNEMISLAKESIIYMEYHECKMFPNRLVSFISEICRHVKEEETPNSLMLGIIILNEFS